MRSLRIDTLYLSAFFLQTSCENADLSKRPITKQNNRLRLHMNMDNSADGRQFQLKVSRKWLHSDGS